MWLTVYIVAVATAFALAIISEMLWYVPYFRLFVIVAGAFFYIGGVASMERDSNQCMIPRQCTVLTAIHATKHIKK